MRPIIQAQLAAQAGETESNAEAAVQTLTVADVVGKTLTLSAIYDASTDTVSQPTTGTYTVVLADQGEMTIIADCNTVKGSYTAGDADAFSIQLGASTRVACAPDSLSDALLATLDKVSVFHAISSNGAISVSLQTADGSLLSLTASE
ncbi:MAG: META domain-containing protein [Chloroflexi bacterium]|nr:META domain-containing protein [Chloroflexota bacterium]